MITQLASILRITSVVATSLAATFSAPAYGQYCPSCANGMCTPEGSGWQRSVGPRTRIVTDLMPEQFPVTGSQSIVSHSAHCRVFVGDGSTGSGTLIARNDSTGLILTCSHLFDESTAEVVVAFPDGSRYAARLIERDPANDLAALLIKRPVADPMGSMILSPPACSPHVATAAMAVSDRRQGRLTARSKRSVLRFQA